MKKGEGTIEFYANLTWLKEQYEAGQVVAKFLYEKAVKERGFKMSYKQFGRYFNEELNQRKHQKEQKIVVEKAIQEEAKKEPEPQEEAPKKREPIIMRMEKKKRVFDPLRGKEVDLSRIL